MDHVENDLGREPTREEVGRLNGLAVLEFGASWCPICQETAPAITALLRRYPDISHIKIEDGRGRPLGRSFGVKYWPTLIFLRDGRIVRQVVRPDENELRHGFETLAGDDPRASA